MTIELFHGDAIAAMNRLPPNSVDLVLADPPYEATQNGWDKIIPFEDMWPAVWRVCKGPVVLTAMQPFSSALVMGQLKFFKHEWVWEKNKATGHLNAKKAPMRAHELALVFARSAVPYHPQMTAGHAPMNAYTQTSNGSNYGVTDRPSGGGSTQRYPRSVQRFDILNNDDPTKEHPTQKPVEWMRYLIETYSEPGGTVLDFCMGSGSTGVAAVQAGRNFFGVEKEEAYFDIAVRRLGLDGPVAGAAE